MTLSSLFTIYWAVLNLAGFAMMGIDKKRAIRGAWRISEASLFLTALLGGALGCTLGMHCFITRPDIGTSGTVCLPSYYYSCFYGYI